MKLACAVLLALLPWPASALAGEGVQTATVERQSARFTLVLQEPPRYVSIEGTSLFLVANAKVPVIRVTPSAYYALQAGVWFTAPTVNGPWIVATTVPAAIYAIPSSSTVHYVTHVRVYSYSPTVVYVGYAPAYVAAAYGGASVNVYGYWGNAAYVGTRAWGVGPNGAAGTAARGSYAAANGTTGEYAASRSYNPNTGVAQRGYGRTFETEGGATGAVTRGEAYNTATGVSAQGAAGTVTGPSGETHSAAAARVGDDRYANVDGTQYRNTGSGWEKRDASSGGWGTAQRNRPSGSAGSGQRSRPQPTWTPPARK